MKKKKVVQYDPIISIILVFNIFSFYYFYFKSFQDVFSRHQPSEKCTLSPFHYFDVKFF